MDQGESEVSRLLKELLASVGSPHANAVLRDAMWVIEDRAVARADPNARDPFVETRIREALSELSKQGSPQVSYELAVELIDALLLIDYTERSNKFTRLCRGILVVMQFAGEPLIRAAQKVFKKMLAEDAKLGRDAPLQTFVPKELKDQCDLAMHQQHGRSGQQLSRQHIAQAFATMLACEAVVQSNYRYAALCRNSIVPLSIQLCGSADASLRRAALGSLVAVLSLVPTGKQADPAVLEIRRIVDDSTRILRSQGQEPQIMGALMSFSAVLESRGASTGIDKAQLAHLCQAIVEQHKVSKSVTVKAVVCSIIPVVAKHDPMFASRKNLYTTVLMEPLKNVRDESEKGTELRNMANYLQNVGLDVLDQPSWTNLESLLLRFVSRKNSQMECWHVLAAVVQHLNQAPARTAAAAAAPAAAAAASSSSGAAVSVKLHAAPQLVADLAVKFLPYLGNAPMTAGLLQHMATVQAALPTALAAQVARATQDMIDTLLRRAASTDSGGSAFPPASPQVLHTTSSGSSLNRLVSYFKTSPVEGPSMTPSQITADEIEVALDALSKRLIDDLNVVEELRVNITPLQRHPSASVRRQCSKTIIDCLSNCMDYVQRCCVPKEEYFDRFVDLVDAYVKTSLLELEPQCRLAQVDFLEISKNIRPLLADRKVVNSMLSFVQDSSRIREVVLRVLVAIAQQWRASDPNDIMSNLKLTVETCVVALEHTADHRVLLRHMAELNSFIRVGVEPFAPLLPRIFAALNSKLSADLPEFVMVTMLKTVAGIASLLIPSTEAALHLNQDLAELYPAIIKTLLDSTSPVVSQCSINVLRVLSQLAPLPDFSNSDRLRIVNALTTAFLSSKLAQSSNEDRNAILTMFGHIGIATPTSADLSVKSRADERTMMASDSDLAPTSDYAVIVYRTLAKVLEEEMLPEALCYAVMRTLLQIVKSSQFSKDIGGASAIKAVLDLIRREPDVRLEAMMNLSMLIGLRQKISVEMLLSEIIVLLHSVWVPSNVALFAPVLDVVGALQPGSLPVKEQMESWPWLYPKLIDAAVQDRTPDKTIAKKIVEIVAQAENLPRQAVIFVTSAFTNFISQSDQPVDLRSAAIGCVVDVVCRGKEVQHLAPLLHALRTLNRHLEMDRDLSSQLAVTVKDSLAKLQRQFPSSRQIVRSIKSQIEDDEGGGGGNRESSPTSTTSFRTPGEGSAFDADRPTRSTGDLDGGMGLRPVTSVHEAQGPADRKQLFEHIERALKAQDEKDRRATTSGFGGTNPTFPQLPSDPLGGPEGFTWKEWMYEFQRLLIVCSPHQVFRITLDLFDKHEPLRRELFYPSFRCMYEALPAEYVTLLNKVLGFALNSGESGEVSAKCLVLADNLDHNPPKLATSARSSSTVTSVTSVGSSPQNVMGVQQQMQNRFPKTPEHTAGETQPPLAAAGLGGAGGLGGTSFPLSSLPMSQRRQLVSSSFRFQESINQVQPAAALGGGGALTNTRGLALSDMALMAARSPGSSPLSSAEPSPASLQPQQQPPPPLYYQTTVLPGDNIIFNTDDLVAAARQNTMFDKAVRYLENRLVLFRPGSAASPASAAGTGGGSSTHHATTHGAGGSGGGGTNDFMRDAVLPLARLYSQMGMQDSVHGLFASIRFRGQKTDAVGFELLQQWTDAKHAYADAVVRPRRARDEDREGYVRTLCFCGEWEAALLAAKESQLQGGGGGSNSNSSSAASATPRESSAIAAYGATAAWVLGEWEDLSNFASRIPQDSSSLQYLFVNAVLFQHDAQANDQAKCIYSAKHSLEGQLRTLLPLGVSHAYESITLLQHFHEISEAFVYRTTRSEDRREQLRSAWRKRFFSIAPETAGVLPMLRSLLVHALVITPKEMPETWIHFCGSVRRAYPQLANWAMRTLQTNTMRHSLASPPGSVVSSSESASAFLSQAAIAAQSFQASPFVRLGYFDHLWETGAKREAVAGLDAFARDTADLARIDPTVFGAAHLKLGLWKQEIYADSFWMGEQRPEVIRHLHHAIRTCPDDYNTWHAWALMNYRIQQRDPNQSNDHRRELVSMAHQGFVAAICRSRSPSDALPDTMRLLQLWIVHHGVTMLKEAIGDCVHRIPVEHWVNVVPQLIAHLGHADYDVREIVTVILRKVCTAHPQTVVFALLVAVVSDPPDLPPSDRGILASSLLQGCSAKVQRDAKLVARLLSEVAVLPIENIRDFLGTVLNQLNSTSQLSYSGVDDEEIKQHLKSALRIATEHRAALLAKVGDIGLYVRRVLDGYQQGKRQEAHALLNKLYDEIEKHVRKHPEEPQQAMSKLLVAHNLAVCVFGEDTLSGTFPTIAHFHPKLEVIPSQKRPRKIRLTGCNGRVYTYCLKANEDLRLDERVMQLFGLVNSFLGQLKGNRSAGMNITRFPVIPIHANVGLLGWVDAETLHSVISRHRSNPADLDTEHHALQDYHGQNWDLLTSIQRADALATVRSETCDAVDIARNMWTRSASAELWLERRTTFTETLATMSMVGYILGLGDRHLSNIMVTMTTGRIVHIDFGDSFDSCRLRQVYPETIPFRLTNMLVHAMEVFGVDGIFRSTCTAVLASLRENRDSITALLSAFVYDPIVSHKTNMRKVMEKTRSPQDIVERIRNKLRGLELAIANEDFSVLPGACPYRPDIDFVSRAFHDTARRLVAAQLSPPEQVDMLITEAMSPENLAAVYQGWSPLW